MRESAIGVSAIVRWEPRPAKWQRGSCGSALSSALGHAWNFLRISQNQSRCVSRRGTCSPGVFLLSQRSSDPPVEGERDLCHSTLLRHSRNVPHTPRPPRSAGLPRPRRCGGAAASVAARRPVPEANVAAKAAEAGAGRAGREGRVADSRRRLRKSHRQRRPPDRRQVLRPVVPLCKAMGPYKRRAGAQGRRRRADRLLRGVDRQEGKEIFKHCKIETIPTALVYCDGQVVASAPVKASTYKKFEDALVLAERRLSTGYFPVNSCEVYSCKSDDPEPPTSRACAGL